MSWQTATALAIVGAFILLAGYDLFAYAKGGNAATISRVCLECTNQYRGFAIVFAFSFGVLFGHLFLPQHVSK